MSETRPILMQAEDNRRADRREATRHHGDTTEDVREAHIRSLPQDIQDKIRAQDGMTFSSRTEMEPGDHNPHEISLK